MISNIPCAIQTAHARFDASQQNKLIISLYFFLLYFPSIFLWLFGSMVGPGALNPFLGIVTFMQNLMLQLFAALLHPAGINLFLGIGIFMHHLGEVSPFLRDQCVLLAILPTGDVLA